MSSTKSLILGLLSIACSSAQASNGINLIGFGAESVGLGGADLAVAADTSALNTNPAGLVQLDRTQLDSYLGLSHALEIRHRDQFGNDRAIDNEWISFGSVGFAHPVSNNLTLGIGLFAQGGIGIEHDVLKTAFGTNDELTALLRIARITPGFAWKVNDKLSIGASLLVTYADVEQKIFPNTSVNNPNAPQQSFFGQHIEDANTFSTGIKLGTLYTPRPDLRIGWSYTSKTELTMDGGQATVNMTDAGLGLVTYRNAELGGIDQPEEAGIGLAWNINERWLLSTEYTWINWSDAIATSFTNLSNPDNPAAPPNLSQRTAINWKDQNVFSLGAKYIRSDKSVIRTGINIANNPIPTQSLSPLLAPTAKYHVTLGYGKIINESWSADLTAEYQIRNSSTYTNPQLPFGQDTYTAGETASLHLVISKRW